MEALRHIAALRIATCRAVRLSVLTVALRIGRLRCIGRLFARCISFRLAIRSALRLSITCRSCILCGSIVLLRRRGILYIDLVATLECIHRNRECVLRLIEDDDTGDIHARKQIAVLRHRDGDRIVGDAVCGSTTHGHLRDGTLEGLILEGVCRNLDLLADLHVRDVELIDVHLEGHLRKIIDDGECGRGVAVLHILADIHVLRRDGTGNRRSDRVILVIIGRGVEIRLRILEGGLRIGDLVLVGLQDITRVLGIHRENSGTDVHIITGTDEQLLDGHGTGEIARPQCDVLDRLEGTVTAGVDAVDARGRVHITRESARIRYLHRDIADELTAGEGRIQLIDGSDGTTELLEGIRERQRRRAARRDLRGLGGKKRDIHLHHAVVVDLRDLCIAGHLITRLDLHRLDITGDGRLHGVSAVIRDGGIVILHRIVVAFLRTLEGARRRVQLRGHGRGVDLVQHLSLGDLITFIKICRDNLALDHRGDRIAVLRRNRTGAGQRLLDRLSRHRTRSYTGLLLTRRSGLLLIYEERTTRDCHEERGSEDELFHRLLPRALLLLFKRKNLLHLLSN